MHWREATSIQLAAQGLGLDEIDDPGFTPRTDLEYQNFVAKNKFVYSVLHSCVRTLKAKSIVQNHLATKDGAQALLDLDTYHSSSSAAIVRRSQLYTALVNFKLDGTWKRSQMDFLTTFLNMLRRHNEYATGPHDVVSDHSAKSFLRNAIHDAANLRDISTRETQDMAMYNASPMDFPKYLLCLETAAGLHDARTGKVSTLAHVTEMSPPHSSPDAPVDDSEPPMPHTDGSMQINAVDSSRPRLPEPLFKQLSQPGKKAWLQIPDTDKAHFVSALPRSINMHDVASTSEFSPLTDADPPSSSGTAATAPSSTQATSVNAASQDSKASRPVARDGKHPADPHRLLSQPPSKSKPDSTSSRQSNTVTFSAPTLTPYEAQAAIQSYWATDASDVFYDCVEDFWKAD